MNDSSDHLGWDDREDTLPPIPDEPEPYGPDIPSQGGDFRFTRTAGQAWADPDGVEVRLLSPGFGGVRFHVDRPLALRLKGALEEVLAADPYGFLSPGSRPPELPKCPQTPYYFVLPFTLDDEPRLTIKNSRGDQWLYLALSSRRAGLHMQLQLAVAFHLHEWLSDAARTPSASRRALGRVFCEVHWPACPTCLGEPLDCSGGLGSCVWCGGKWLAAGTCIAVASHQLIDKITGDRNYICSSHAESARREITNVVVEPLPVVPS
jgi:hypothetical protein